MMAQIQSAMGSDDVTAAQYDDQAGNGQHFQDTLSEGLHKVVPEKYRETDSSESSLNPCLMVSATADLGSSSMLSSLAF